MHETDQTDAGTTASVTAPQLRDRLAARADGGPDFVLIDIREAWERDIVAIDGSVLVPMNQLLTLVQGPPGPAAESLPQDTRVVLYCHLGVRSDYARQVLAQQGWTDVTRLDGGVDAWVREIEPDLPLY
jgi:rhodanese-related sulfurtransferase